MALWKDVAAAFVASREWDQATLSRLKSFNDQLGEKYLVDIKEDAADACLLALAERGRR